MRYFLCLALYFLCLDLNAQVFPLVDGKIAYEQIDTVIATKDYLFLKSKVWLDSTFKYGISITRKEDKDAGILTSIVKNMYSFRYQENAYFMSKMNFTLLIECEDKRAKIKIYNIELEKLEGGSEPIDTFEFWDKNSIPLIQSGKNLKLDSGVLGMSIPVLILRIGKKYIAILRNLWILLRLMIRVDN